jgi:hypothetical protein
MLWHCDLRRRQQARFSGETTKETVKTIARGMPGVSGVTVVDLLGVLFSFAPEAAGAPSARHSLRPLIPEDGIYNDSEANCFAGM